MPTQHQRTWMGSAAPTLDRERRDATAVAAWGLGTRALQGFRFALEAQQPRPQAGTPGRIGVGHTAQVEAEPTHHQRALPRAGLIADLKVVVAARQPHEVVLGAIVPSTHIAHERTRPRAFVRSLSLEKSINEKAGELVACLLSTASFCQV